MVKTDVIEGTIDDRLWYHYDRANDVLYVRLASERDVPTLAEESPDGTLLTRREADGTVIGLTIVSWWKRFGVGALPDSLALLERHIEPWARKVAA